MKIIPLSEGAFTVDRTKVFVPFDERVDRMSDRPAGSLLVEVQPFLVITERDVLLLDTGLGFSTEGVPQLHRLMMNEGINPSEVTKVLLSHLHKDHSGGVQLPGSQRLSFVNAKYYVQRQELDYALGGGSGSYIAADVVGLKDHPQTVLLDGNGTIDEYISYEMTSAHSPFHQVFTIREEGQVVFFGGDDAPQVSQMKNRYVAKYDFDGKKCMLLRQQWWAEGHQHHWTFLFYHDIATPVVKL